MTHGGASDNTFTYTVRAHTHHEYVCAPCAYALHHVFAHALIADECVEKADFA